MWKSASKLDMPINTIELTADYQNCTGMYTLPHRVSSQQKRTNHYRWGVPSLGGAALACKGRAGSPAPVLGSWAQVCTTLCCLLLLPHFESGEQLDQPDVPLLWQEQEKEAQANDDDGDDPNPVEDYLAGVVIHHCGRQSFGYLAARMKAQDQEMLEHPTSLGSPWSFWATESSWAALVPGG